MSEGVRVFSLSTSHTWSASRPASYLVGTGSFSPRVQQSGHDVCQLHLAPGFRMSGAVSLHPPVCLYVVDRDGITFFNIEEMLITS